MLSDFIEIFARAKRYMPGGVNSPVRSFQAVGGTPIFFKSGKGAYLFDLKGHSYLDYVGSWGPMLLGHSAPEVVLAVQKACAEGLSFGACHPDEVALAREVCQKIPSIEQVRFVNSGTEAAMSVLRLARAVTQRQKIVKFSGCYHGHVDALLVEMGSGGLTFGVPSSAGVPSCVVEDTLVAQYNCLASVQDCFEQHGHEIAAVIIEPVAANMGCVPADSEFLAGLKELCQRYGSLLIFDEVVTGFRMAEGGAQSVYGILPDMTMLGKVLGGGMPVAAFGASREIMSLLAPQGPVYQAGTLSGNPLAMAAGLAMLAQLSSLGFYQRLMVTTTQLAEGIKKIAQEEGISCCVQYVCGMLSLFFTSRSEVRCYDEVQQCDVERFKRFFNALLHQGVYWPPSAFETAFVSIAHCAQDIASTLDKIRIAFRDLAG